MHSNVLPIFSLFAYSFRLLLLRLLLFLSLLLILIFQHPPRLLVLPFTLCFFLLSPFLLSLFSLYSSPSLYSTLSILSLFGNAALLALLFPIYASLLKCPSFFSSFFSLPHWSLSFSPSFFSLIVALPPLPLSLFIRPFLRLLRPLPRPLLFMGHISPSVPLFSLQSSFFPSCPPFFDTLIPLFFFLSYLPSPPTLAQIIIIIIKGKWVLLLLSYTLASIQSWSLLPFFFFLPPPFSPPLAPSFCIPPPNSALFSPRHGSHYSFRSPLCPSNHPPPSPRLHPCLSPSSSSPSPALPSPLNWGCVTSFIFNAAPLFPHATRFHFLAQEDCSPR